MTKGRILVVEESCVAKQIRTLLEAWDYDVVDISKADFIDDVVKRNDIDLMILAVEMQSGGSWVDVGLSKDAAERREKLKNLSVDFEFGFKLGKRLKEKGVDIPIVFISTADPMEEPIRVRQDDGRLNLVVIPKLYRDFTGVLQASIEEYLPNN